MISRPEFQLSGLLAMAVLAGGGGVGAAFPNLSVQLFALALLALNAGAVGRFVSGAPALLRALLALTILLPVSQLVPVPPAVWQAMPGRDLVTESLALVGGGHDWRPLSVAPARTVLALVGLIVPFTALVLALQLDAKGRNAVLGAIVALGFVNLALGTVQLVTGNQIGHFYGGKVDASQLYGTFANHNTAGIFFVIALLAALGIKETPGWETHIRALRWIGGGLFALAVVLTQSRSAFIVLVVVGLLLGLLAGVRAIRSTDPSRRSGRRSRTRKRTLLAAFAALFVLGSISAAFLATSGKVAQTTERFSIIEDDIRPRIWADALVSLDRFWPLGSGMGTFDEVFQLDESLENLEPGRAGRAHNEYLEVPIEAGLAGCVLITAWLLWLGFLVWRLVRGGSGAVLLAPGGAVLAIVLQSGVDYPLRSQAGLCLGAVMAALLWREVRALKQAQ